MALPQARIVKQGGQLFAPPPPPPAPRRGPTYKEQLREVARFAIGMWPVTAVMLLMLGFMIIGANWSSP